MEFCIKLNRSALNELFNTYTKRFIKVLLRGEQYPGEYDHYKRTLKMIQQKLGCITKEADNTSLAGSGFATRFIA